MARGICRLPYMRNLAKHSLTEPVQAAAADLGRSPGFMVIRFPSVLSGTASAPKLRPADCGLLLFPASSPESSGPPPENAALALGAARLASSAPVPREKRGENGEKT